MGKVYPKEAEIELLGRIDGKSFEQSARVLAAISPEQVRPEKARVLNEEDTEIRFTADRALMIKLERLKNLMGHQTQAQTYAGLIGELADLALKKLDPLEKKPEVLPISEVRDVKFQKTVEKEAAVKKMVHQNRYIPEKIRRFVWQRDQGRCSFVDSKSGRKCESRHALEIDHLHPVGKGGSSDIGNLRLLCAVHNQFAAVEAYGLIKMQRFWIR